MKGIAVEMEHVDTLQKVKENPTLKTEDVAEMIARDHLKEDPNYYTKLKDVENSTKLKERT